MSEEMCYFYTFYSNAQLSSCNMFCLFTQKKFTLCSMSQVPKILLHCIAEACFIVFLLVHVEVSWGQSSLSHFCCPSIKYSVIRGRSCTFIDVTLVHPCLFDSLPGLVQNNIWLYNHWNLSFFRCVDHLLHRGSQWRIQTTANVQNRLLKEW